MPTDGIVPECCHDLCCSDMRYMWYASENGYPQVRKCRLCKKVEYWHGCEKQWFNYPHNEPKRSYVNGKSVVQHYGPFDLKHDPENVEVVSEQSAF